MSFFSTLPSKVPSLHSNMMIVVKNMFQDGIENFYETKTHSELPMPLPIVMFSSISVELSLTRPSPQQCQSKITLGPVAICCS